MDLKASELTTVVPIVLVCAAILGLYLFLPGGSPAPESPQISLSLDASQPYISGRAATLRAFSTCGPFGVYIDGERSGEGASYAQLPLALRAGSHLFEAKNGNCSASIAISVAASQCDGNQTEQCTANGCEGFRICSNGVFSICIIPRKVCVPGEKIGCSVDGCAFGHATCNPCGSGFGECLPDNGGSSGVSCINGTQCS